MIAACAHGGAAPAPRPSTPRASSAPRSQPQQPPREPTAEKAQLDSYMPEHFAIITWARDSVINGELDALREPLRALADYRYPDVEPGSWMSAVARIQQTARAGSEASTLPLAASAVAAMARQCGDCHRQLGRALENDALKPFRASDAPETLAMRMQRHGWAADRMWEALVMPSERAWFQGASALANAPSELPAAEDPLAPELASALAQLRALGTQALDAEDWDARVDSYSRLLVSCSDCHSTKDEAP